MISRSLTHFWLMLALLIFQAQSAFANVPCNMMSAQLSDSSASSMAGMQAMDGMDHSMHQMPSMGSTDPVNQALLDCCGDASCAMAGCVAPMAVPSNSMGSATAIYSAAPDLYGFSYSSLDLSPSTRPPVRR